MILSAAIDLLAEHVRAPPHIALRGDGRQCVERHLRLAEAGLPSPDGDDDARRHAILVLHGGKLLRPLAQLAAPGRGEHAQRSLVEVVRRDVELGLMDGLGRQSLWQRWPARHGRVGQHEMRQRPVELQPLDIGVEGLARDPRRFGIWPQRLQPSRRRPCLPRAYRRQSRRQPLAPRPAPVPRARAQSQTDPPKSRCRHPARLGLAPHDSRLPEPILAVALRRRKGKMARR